MWIVPPSTFDTKIETMEDFYREDLIFSSDCSSLKLETRFLIVFTSKYHLDFIIHTSLLVLISLTIFNFFLTLSDDYTCKMFFEEIFKAPAPTTGHRPPSRRCEFWMMASCFSKHVVSKEWQITWLRKGRSWFPQNRNLRHNLQSNLSKHLKITNGSIL